mmetsp:Transcript_41366/g.54392  ORF Transcript_41366/g.54392 Transcript_41366/m.54392 type:complete len:205 (-) Transcript_41366:2339-2953(-)
MIRETPIHKVWPFTKYLCCCCLNKRKRSFKLALKNSIRKKLDIPVEKADKVIEKDPYLLFGYGINSYFSVIQQLFTLMLLISCLAVPLAAYFATFSGTNGEVLHYFSQFSIGNLGGASTYCTQTNLGDNKRKSNMILHCPTGALDLTATSQDTGLPIFSAGIIPSSSELSNYCAASSFKDPANCSSYLDSAALQSEIQKNCTGK